MTASILESYGHFRRNLARLSAAQLKKTDLGFFQMSMIYFLATGEASGCSELAECTQTDRAAVSRALASMAKLGLISRAKDDADRRREIIQLTNLGRQKAKEVFKARDSIAAKIAESLSTKEARELARLLEKASGSADFFGFLGAGALSLTYSLISLLLFHDPPGWRGGATSQGRKIHAPIRSAILVSRVPSS